ncbi:MAG: FtsW/RodA/SpoVE family cell cycle protein, partial [Bacteroidota bacterium]|nr:FtsW/RodA/SpoVE family cell cycle protein [Bacteroidota bacterium]
MTNILNKIIKGDKTIIYLVIALLLISSFIMASALNSLSIKENNFSFYYLFKQLIFASVAFITMILVSQIPYQIFSKISKPLFLFLVVLLLFTVFFGKSINGSRRWLEIPFIGLTIQTSDFVRIGLVIYIAHIMSKYNPIRGDFNDMLKKVLLWGTPVALIIAKTDYSTAILTIVLILTMLFFSPIKFKGYVKKAGIVTIIVVSLFILSMIFGFGKGDTAKGRIDGKTAIYDQEVQCKIAISKAPIIPKPGSSTQKYLLANSYSDFAFAIGVEEYGFLGAFLIIVLYLVLLKRILLIVKNQKRTFPMYLSLGLSMNILSQAFM